MSEREFSARPPNGVATRWVWFTDMTEREFGSFPFSPFVQEMPDIVSLSTGEVYTGAARAVRRNGSSSPRPRPEGGYM